MATEAKRQKVADDTEISPLDRFLQWCEQVGLRLSDKVYVSREGTVAEYGMIARDDIEEGEVLFTVPRIAILDQESSKVSDVLKKEKNLLEAASSWVPLLLALLHEYTSSQSHWRPYLSLWSDFRKLDHPMFWSKEERDKLLMGTEIPPAVDTDLAKISEEYTEVVLPLIQKHPEYWSPEIHTLQLYTQLVSFVMAYSFQEPHEEDEDDEDDDDDEENAPNPPMMVPMADMLNHISDHNANLEFTLDSLKMVSIRPIHKGEEVFNTYGQMPNWQLLHMYGFTEPFPSNGNDTVDITISNFYKAAQGILSDRQLLEEKLKMLKEMEGNDTIIFGKQGCLTDSALNTVLKVFCMSRDEFLDFKENEGWEDDDDEEDIALAFSNKGLPKLKAVWKRLIQGATRLTLSCYTDSSEVNGRDQDPDKMLLEDKAAFVKLTSRQQRALHVRYGQKSILHELLHLTK